MIAGRTREPKARIAAERDLGFYAYAPLPVPRAVRGR
jgi:hypothetical protein